jgi:23S rRNA-intervening sequence protein
VGEWASGREEAHVKERIKSYKELRVYQAAMEAAMRVFELTKRFPAEERY